MRALGSGYVGLVREMTRWGWSSHRYLIMTPTQGKRLGSWLAKDIKITRCR